MKRLIFFILPIIIFLNIKQTFAADPPEIKCLQVNEDGTVKLYWTYVASVNFEVYNSIDKVAWNRVFNSAVELSNNIYTIDDNSVNANDQSIYYKVIAITDTSEICGTMFLSVDNSIEGIAYLSWSPISEPMPIGTDQYYNVYMSVNKNNTLGPWKLIADEENPKNTYIVENGFCSDSLCFKVEILNSIISDKSISNITCGEFSEAIQPNKPVLDSVSVINNSKVIIGWNASTSPDVMGAYIYTGKNWEVVKTITPYYNTYYIDSSYNPCDTVYEYAIAAFDSCMISSPGSYDTPQRPILITDLQSDLCTSTISVSWDPYINPVNPIDKYRVWAVVNSKDTIVAGEVDGNTTSFIHDNILQNTQYTYFIRAYFGNYTSTSCSKSITTSSYILPQNLYFVNSTVLEDNSIDLSLDIDLNPINCTWEIYRSDANSSNLKLLKTYTRDQVSSSLFEYNDIDANGSDGYYYYNAIVYDSCGNESIISNTLKTMYLSGELPAENIIKLTWNEFEGWDAGVEKYYIYRMSDNIIPQNPIDSTNSQTTDYSDDISNVSLSTTEFIYWITAVEKAGNIYGYREESNSNRISFIRETELYLPNAFRPDGINNRIFAPVVAGYAGSDYTMQIFNRWGQMIFESFSPHNGWDGTMGGKSCSAGLYVYKIRYKTSKNEQKDYQGTVMLIR